MESTFIYNFTYLHIINWAIALPWLISPSNSKTLEVDIYHFAIQKRNIHTHISTTTPPSDYAILLRLSVTGFAAYLHKAKISLKITSITYAAIRVNSAVWHTIKWCKSIMQAFFKIITLHQKQGTYKVTTPWCGTKQTFIIFQDFWQGTNAFFLI